MIENLTLEPTYERWLDEQEAIGTGIATELAPCLRCERVILSDTEEFAPMRGVVDSKVVGFDPTFVLYLSCGHVTF
jgi:hypothetical protein